MDIFEWVNHQLKQLSFDMFIQTWKKSFIIEGRADRQEFWNFQIIMGLLSVGSLTVAAILGLDLLFYLLVLCVMVSFVPSFTLGIRRCHDLELPEVVALSLAFSTFIPVVGQFIYYGAIGGIPTKKHIIEQNKV
jgi:uncharacterized membrane protein YhaH (DUF805 family)